MGLIPNLRAWHMINVDTGEELEGQYEAVGLAETPGAPEYAGHTSLNRQDEILQFLHGNPDHITFNARLFAPTTIDDISDEIETLKEWRKRNDKTGRPPVIVFWVGGRDVYMECVIESVGSIAYDHLTWAGGLRGATIPVTLRQYVPFKLGDAYIHETRYHRAREGDYYELLAYREYGAPLFGDLVRRRHPRKRDLQIGDVVKLPSVAALKTQRVVPHSLVFKDSFLQRATPTKTRREQILAARNVPYVSHIIEG